MTSTDFAAAFMEGVKINASPISGVNYEDLAFSLAKLLHDSRRTLESHRKQAEMHVQAMDDVVNEFPGIFTVKCRSCEEMYELPCNLSEFNADMSYCGGSPRCCP